MNKLLAAVAIAVTAASCSQAPSSEGSLKAANGFNQTQTFTAIAPTGISSTGMLGLFSPIQSQGLEVRVTCSIRITQVVVSFDNNGFNDAVGPLIDQGNGTWRTSGRVRTFRGIQIQASNSFVAQSCTYSVSALGGGDTVTAAFDANGNQLACTPDHGPVLPCAFNPDVSNFAEACSEAGFHGVSCAQVGGCGFACSGNPI